MLPRGIWPKWVVLPRSKTNYLLITFKTLKKNSRCVPQLNHTPINQHTHKRSAKIDLDGIVTLATEIDLLPSSINLNVFSQKKKHIKHLKYCEYSSSMWLCIVWMFCYIFSCGFLDIFYFLTLSLSLSLSLTRSFFPALIFSRSCDCLNVWPNIRCTKQRSKRRWFLYRNNETLCRKS